MNYYHYVTKNLQQVRIKAKSKPSSKNVPPSGTWVLQEYCPFSEAWVSPAFPEITFSTIKKELKFVRKEPIPEKQYVVGSCDHCGHLTLNKAESECPQGWALFWETLLEKQYKKLTKKMAAYKKRGPLKDF